MYYVQNLRLKFPGEDSLLFRDLSFTISRGEKVLLLGPSGSGKSTLLQVLSGIIPKITEVPIVYDDAQLPASWGYVFQDPDTQFAMPFVDEELAFVLENLQVSREEMDEKIAHVLALVGLTLDDPHTLIEDLSQGMKQRLALASVLLLEPDVLFLDEPSALLDPEGTEQIWDTVKRLTHDQTVIIVEHKIDLLEDFVDRVVLLNHEGEIVASGPPEYIFTEYRQTLIDDGIWYPGVWEQYVDSSSYEMLFEQREQVIGKPLVLLEDFRAFRGEEEKLYVPQATVTEGEWITIIGDNGAGKSTLLLALMQLLETSGTYEVNGRTIQGAKKAKHRVVPKELTLVFQNPELQFVTNTIYEEVALGLKLRGASDEEVETFVRDILPALRLDVGDERHPFQLSTGQKRRLSVATALTTEATILLLDEPTFGQDAYNTFRLLEELEKMRQRGHTIIMVTHDLNIVRYFATTTWRIDQGELVEVIRHD